MHNDHWINLFLYICDQCRGGDENLCAGVQPWQDPGGTLRMNGIGWREREKTHETSLDRAKSARERERVTRQGVQQSLAGSGNALFFTVAFIT